MFKELLLRALRFGEGSDVRIIAVDTANSSEAFLLYLFAYIENCRIHTSGYSGYTYSTLNTLIITCH